MVYKEKDLRRARVPVITKAGVTEKLRGAVCASAMKTCAMVSGLDSIKITKAAFCI